MTVIYVENIFLFSIGKASWDGSDRTIYSELFFPTWVFKCIRDTDHNKF